MGSGSTGSGKGVAFVRSDSGAGALSVSGSGYYNVNGATGTSVWARHVSFDASASNPIYGNSDTVQPPSINQLLYICVGNTNVESAVTDVVDVTTTENDTMPLFTGMYFDFTPNNVSWLKAGQQANSGGVYTFTYNELVNILNGETKYGDLKVIDVADMVTGEDYSLYWKVNQTNMTFITPTAISNKALSGGVMGNGDALGLTGGTGSSEWNGNLGNSVVNLQTQGTDWSQHLSLYTNATSDGTTFGLTTDSTKSGIIAEEATSQLYFKVANAVQNLELLDAGEVLEAVNNVVPNNRLVWDGQWQDFANGVVLLQNVGAGSYSFDLSQYLPNDNNPYEILCGVTTYGDTYISFESNGIKTGTVHGGGQSIVFQVVVPVSATKQLIVNVMTGTSANAVVSINNYRRLGTNI